LLKNCCSLIISFIHNPRNLEQYSLNLPFYKMKEMNTNTINEPFQKDIDNIRQIPIIGSLLDVVCQTTGMGFAAVARVTEDIWMACSVRDDINFGLLPGGELEIKTTICNEIRQSGQPVVIDCVLEDADFKDHHTPAMYGFQSYISVPIILKDGSFFGTLCAIDPNPKIVKTPAIIGMFTLFADLISFHLDTVMLLDHNRKALVKERAFTEELEKRIKERTAELEEKNEVLVRMNAELQSFTYISSHDLQEPLRKIQTFVSRIDQTESEYLSESGRELFTKLKGSAERMRMLINDLLTYSHADVSEQEFEVTDLNAILSSVKEDLEEELLERKAIIEAAELCHAPVIPFQFRQMLYNLISNSVKYASPERPSKIKVYAQMIPASAIIHDFQPVGNDYYHIHVIDNGIGFDPVYKEKIFEVFQRLHHRSSFSGTGIGLAIVKKIVENHNGKIYAEGKLNEGAAFHIYLPAN
jgi:signal transduction histidine kinase